MEIDPFLFTDEAVSDETRAFNARLREELLAMPRTSSQDPQTIRDGQLDGKGPFGPVVYSEHARTVTIEGPGGDLDLRIIETADPVDAVYVHIHGGGWVLGAADQADAKNEALARAANVAVVSIDYRLAPEHPFPAAVEDCVAGARWVVENASAEFGTDLLTIGGESAGANLAAVVLQRLRDDVGYTGWLAANLVYGVYLPSGTPSARRWDVDGYVLDSDTMSWFGNHYVADASVPFDDPNLAPVHGDLRNMPPALFTIGTLDPLLDDSLFMAARWAAAGNDTHLAVYPGGVHAFDAFDITIATRARTTMHTFITEAIHR